MTSVINILVSQPAESIIKVEVSDTILQGTGGGGTDSSAVVFEGIVGGETVLTGTANTLTGFDEGSDLITLSDFEGKRVEIQRGGQDSPTIGPYAVFTKDLSSDSILLTTALEDGEYLKIKTIP